MEWQSTLKHTRISPRKARLVADMIRGMGVGEALGLLQFTPKKAAHIIKKVVQSAVANATPNFPSITLDSRATKARVLSITVLSWALKLPLYTGVPIMIASHHTILS